MFLGIEDEPAENPGNLRDYSNRNKETGKEYQYTDQNGELDDLWNVGERKGHRLQLAHNTFNGTQVGVGRNARNRQRRRTMRTIRIDTAVLRARLHLSPAIDAFKANRVPRKGASDGIEAGPLLFLPRKAIGRRLVNRAGG